MMIITTVLTHKISSLLQQQMMQDNLPVEEGGVGMVR